MSPEYGEELQGVAARLTSERPLPHPGFRGELRRRLLRPTAAPPRRLRTMIAAYAGSGALLLAIVAAGVAGVGPLAG